MDQDKIRVTQLVHVLLTSKILKTVDTQSYLVFSLHRPEETSMRLRPTSIVLGDSNNIEEDPTNILSAHPEHLFNNMNKSKCSSKSG